jgi:peptidoglycan/LPS O-acetylase OafA/YrhL
MERLKCLDGLRGVLAVYVMLGHMAPFAVLPARLASALSHGGAAVDVFFILSGLAIVRSLESVGYRARPFLAARVARIFPVYLAMFALAVAVQPLPAGFGRMPWIEAGSPAFSIWSQGWPSAWLPELAAHLTMTHGLIPDGVLPDAWVSFLGAAWSLSTEWQFYVLALLLGRRAWWVLLGIAMAGAIWAAATPEGWHFSRAFLGNKAGYFVLGMVSAGLVARPEDVDGGPAPAMTLNLYQPTQRLIRPLASHRHARHEGGHDGERWCSIGHRFGRPIFWRYVATSAFVMALGWWQGGPGKILPPLVWAVCLAAEAWPWLLSSALRSRPAQWLGGLSYSLYLANEPVQKLLGIALGYCAAGDGRWFTALWVPGALGLPLLVAMALRRWIEVPALAWARRGGYTRRHENSR